MYTVESAPAFVAGTMRDATPVDMPDIYTEGSYRFEESDPAPWRPDRRPLLALVSIALIIGVAVIALAFRGGDDRTVTSPFETITFTTPAPLETDVAEAPATTTPAVPLTTAPPDTSAVASAAPTLPPVGQPGTTTGTTPTPTLPPTLPPTTPPITPAPATTVPAVDTDGDGVPDASDQCRSVDGTLRGCPDTDKDGFAENGDDLCPGASGTVRGCPDRDGDGVQDTDDRCPTRPGGGDQSGCRDTDGDSFRDDIDLCPDASGTVGGCPDGDGDGVADASDSCPSDSGPASNKGCPDPDRDHDGILNDPDVCPDEAGTNSYHGCPAPEASISAPGNPLCSGVSYQFVANVSNGQFVQWSTGSSSNPLALSFDAGQQSLTAQFVARDNQPLQRTVSLTVVDC